MPRISVELLTGLASTDGIEYFIMLPVVFIAIFGPPLYVVSRLVAALVAMVA